MRYDKDGWLEGVKRRPLGPQTEPLIQDKVLIFHVIVGSAEAGYAVFKPSGYDGDESHFIVCGPRDKAAGHNDGELWQLQDIHHQADAQFAGNAYGISAETSGMPTEPWSSAMLETLIDLTVVTCRQENLPVKLVPRTGPVGKGLGYHELREDWNTDHHSCPGPVREGQLRTIIIPKARARLAGHTEPKAPRPRTHPVRLHVDGIFGPETVGALQREMRAPGGYYKGHVDGIFGPATRTALKVTLHEAYGFSDVSTKDPDIGRAAVVALQEHVKARVHDNGAWTKDTTEHLQTWLNHHHSF